MDPFDQRQRLALAFVLHQPRENGTGPGFAAGRPALRSKPSPGVHRRSKPSFVHPPRIRSAAPEHVLVRRPNDIRQAARAAANRDICALSGIPAPQGHSIRQGAPWSGTVDADMPDARRHHEFTISDPRCAHDIGSRVRITDKCKHRRPTRSVTVLSGSLVFAAGSPEYGPSRTCISPLWDKSVSLAPSGKLIACPVANLVPGAISSVPLTATTTISACAGSNIITNADRQIQDLFAIFTPRAQVKRHFSDKTTFVPDSPFSSRSK
jgi:hypothetical protein